MRKRLYLPGIVLSVSLVHLAAGGTISGTVTNPAECLGVQVLSREGHHPLRPKVIDASYDPRTGSFRTTDLPDGVYDLRLLIKGGVVEGVDMRVPPPGEGEAKPLTAWDEGAIRDYITRPVASFMDIKRPLLVRGHAEQACALVEVVRHRSFYEGRPDDLIWGVEIWYLENQTNAWVRPPGARRRRKVLRRVYVPRDIAHDAFEKSICLFDPKLGGIELDAETARRHISVTVPGPDSAFGKVPGSVRKQIEEDRKAHPNRFD